MQIYIWVPFDVIHRKLNSAFTNNFYHNLELPSDPEVHQSLLQQDAQMWERLLWTSGGLLNLTKCYSQSIQWDFDKKRQTNHQAARLSTTNTNLFKQWQQTTQYQTQTPNIWPKIPWLLLHAVLTPDRSKRPSTTNLHQICNQDDHSTTQKYQSMDGFLQM